MHHIFHTEGIILGSRDYGEAGKYYQILTRDFGLVFASAQGVRKLSSKLRFVLQDFSYVKIDLVKGRDMWRITSASKTGKLEEILKNKNAFFVFINIARLLKRLLADEENNEKLFMDLLNGLKVLEKEKDIEKIKNIEIILVLRILHSLGYLGAGAEVKDFVNSPFEDELIFSFSAKRANMLREINKILRETHL